MVSKTNSTNEQDVPIAISVMKSNELYLSMKGVCEKLSISKATGGRWKREGRFPEAIVINGVPRYRDSDIEKMIAEQNEATEEKTISSTKSRIKKG